MTDLRQRLRARGKELRATGLSMLRTQRQLRKEFPAAERDECWLAAGLQLGRDTPIWEQLNAQMVAEARFRGPKEVAPRGRRD